MSVYASSMWEMQASFELETRRSPAIGYLPAEQIMAGYGDLAGTLDITDFPNDITLT